MKRTGLRTLLAALAVTLCSTALRAQGPHGLFVYSWNVASTSAPPPVCPTCPSSPAQDLVNALALPGIDGITLVTDWSLIEPRLGVYQWDLTATTAWSSSATYVRGDAVFFSAQVYVSNLNHNKNHQPDVSPNDWQAVGGTADLFDQWFAAAAALGKQVHLAIRAGGGDTGLATPCWLFSGSVCGNGFSGLQASATALTFDASAHQGTARCSVETIAAPWDPSFLAQWDVLLAALARHLETTHAIDVLEYDVMSMVRLTGINRTTDEFRLPEEMPGTLGSCKSPIASIQEWLRPPAPLAPYSPSLLFDPTTQTGAWVTITTSFATHFPGKDFNVAIIPDNTGSGQSSGVPQYPFPEIDDAGCVYSPPLTATDLALLSPVPCTAPQPMPDDNANLIRQASQAFAGHMTIEFESLNTKNPANPYVIDQSQVLNTGAAYMTNDWAASGGSVCQGGLGSPPCATAKAYLGLLQNGIFLTAPGGTHFRSQFLEVFYPNVNMFPCATWHAHVDLTDYTPPVTTGSISGPAGTNGWYLGPVHLDFTATDASTNANPSCPLPIVTQYKLDNGAWTRGRRVTLRADDKYTVRYRSTDAARNVETPQIRHIDIDSIAPVTTASVATFPTGVVDVRLAATDNLSGVARTEFSLDHGKTWTSGTTVLLTSDGTYTVRYRSIDMAGNVEPAQSFTVTVTLKGPPCHVHCV